MPDTSPTDSDSRKLLPPPLIIMHRIDVSDTQDDTSHAVEPACSTPQYDARPSPEPRNVKLIEPVAPMFARSIELS